MEKNKCGQCKDYYICKSDSKLRGKYLPKNKKACEEFIADLKKKNAK